MQALIIFDVNTGSDDVKYGLQNMGYHSAWIDIKTDITYNLPSNTVWKPDSELSVALKDIKSIINELNNRGKNIILLRCIVVSAHPWEGEPGTRS